MLHLLAEQPLLLLAIFMLTGAWLGHVKISGVSLGPAGVLFSAIILTALGVSAGVTFEIPEVVGTLGLILFTYTVGTVSGPNFFASLRKGWPAMATVVATFAVVAVLAVVIGRALGLTKSVIAGTFAGALTNTPALAAATEQSADKAGPVIGYSISYLFGWVLKAGHRVCQEARHTVAPSRRHHTVPRPVQGQLQAACPQPRDPVPVM